MSERSNGEEEGESEEEEEMEMEDNRSITNSTSTDRKSRGLSSVLIVTHSNTYEIKFLLLLF